MNGVAKWLSGTTAAGLFVLLATYGKQAAEALQGFIPLISGFASVLPFGFKSFLLALLLSMLVFAVIFNRTHSKVGFAAEAAALCVALLVSLLQQRFGPAPTTGGSTLMAVWIGLGAGLGAPFLVRMLIALAPVKPETPAGG